MSFEKVWFSESILAGIVFCHQNRGVPRKCSSSHNYDASELLQQTTCILPLCVYRMQSKD
uniref:Uncharacterized protein n=1 Tax=Anguilla anguilla TaxID=7936 RepID=A0A0E9S5S7_ANGAN